MTAREKASAEVRAVDELFADERRHAVFTGVRSSLLLALHLYAQLRILWATCDLAGDAVDPRIGSSPKAQGGGRTRGRRT